MPKGEVYVLKACANHPDGVQRNELTTMTGYKRSTRDLYVQKLAQKGYVEIRGDSVCATQAGVDALGTSWEPLPTGARLLEFHLNRLPEGERRVLSNAVAAYPNSVTRDQVSELTGYKRSTRDLYIQRLTSRRLVISTSQGVQASHNLFD